MRQTSELNPHHPERSMRRSDSRGGRRSRRSGLGGRPTSQQGTSHAPTSAVGHRRIRWAMSRTTRTSLSARGRGEIPCTRSAMGAGMPTCASTSTSCCCTRPLASQAPTILELLPKWKYPRLRLQMVLLLMTLNVKHSATVSLSRRQCRHLKMTWGVTLGLN